MPSNHRRQFRVHLRIWIKMKLLCSETRISTCLGAFHCSYIHMKYWRCVLWILNEHCFCNGNNDKVKYNHSQINAWLPFGLFQIWWPVHASSLFQGTDTSGFLSSVDQVNYRQNNEPMRRMRAMKWRFWRQSLVCINERWRCLPMIIELNAFMFPHESCFSCCQNGVVFWKSSGICPGEAKNSSIVQYGFRWWTAESCVIFQQPCLRSSSSLTESLRILVGDHLTYFLNKQWNLEW